jgi:poly(A) polymerase
VALDACARNLEGLARLSVERVGSEMLKLLAAVEPRAAVQAMATAGVLGAVLPGATDLVAFDRAVEIERFLAYNPGPLRRLAALTVNQTADLRDRLRLSNNQSVHLAGVAALAPLIAPSTAGPAARILIYKNGRAVWRDAVITDWSLAGDPVDSPDWQRLADLSAWEVPVFPVSGKDLVARGVLPGKEMGARLKDLERRWLDSDFQLNFSDLIG